MVFITKIIKIALYFCFNICTTLFPLQILSISLTRTWYDGYKDADWNILIGSHSLPMVSFRAVVFVIFDLILWFYFKLNENPDLFINLGTTINLEQKYNAFVIVNILVALG